MAQAYITENSLGPEFFYFAVWHAAMMLNQVTGRLVFRIATPFELIHNTKANSKTWFGLFSIGYLKHSNDNTERQSKLQDHTFDGIAVGRGEK